ncbi:MAG: para-aminobenzoate synthetase component [Petroclostridium sp.]|jgi:para-aminobenzoate synthetase component 1|nr:para-aminobenzoate synthase, subunit [Clostridia bacterium]MDK2809375.1 para-aminobenzoate synthetase component [Petroclostridium sp.]
MSEVYIEEIHTSLSAFDIYKLFSNKEYSFFLDSGMDPNRLGRYSFIGANPFLRIEAKNSSITVWEENTREIYTGNPFLKLKELLGRYHIENNTELPFVGGAVGFLAYDLCHHIEKLPRTAVDDLQLPDMILGFYDGIVVIDHLKNKIYAVSAGLPQQDRNMAWQRVKDIRRRIEQGTIINIEHLDQSYTQNHVELVSNFTKEDYCKAIERAREYIRCGDIFQVNMTQRFTTYINRHPLNIYSYLRTINPAPFAAYMDYGDMKIVSSSPERFIQKRGNMLETRPIKGTISRSKNEKEDILNKEILQNSIKDRAENVMIVDLMRNDIGRVCSFGSVQVPELFCVETYATVHHLVSTVKGRLNPEYDAVDCIAAAFPGGSITGAPKIRAMEIIDELEPTCRHIYTGCIGYIGFDGDMDLNIVIRTMLVKGNRAYYQVGGGIVWDSVPEKEYQETLDKGLALRRALLER